jgi:hypothetical protein
VWDENTMRPVRFDRDSRRGHAVVLKQKKLRRGVAMRYTFSLLAMGFLCLAAQAQRGGPGGDRGSGGGGPPSSGGVGGFSGGGFRGMPTADDSFNQLVQSYGGTGDALDYSKVSQERRDRFNRFASFGNMPQMPTSGIITRDQYRVEFAKRMESMQSRWGGGGNNSFIRGGPPTATAPGSPTPSGSVTMTVNSMNVAPSTAPNMAPPGERPVAEEEVQRFIRRYDKDNDSRVSFAEAQESDRLKPVFAFYDKNADGFLDSAEFRTYVQDRFNGRSPESMAAGHAPPPQGSYDPRGGYDRGGDSSRKETPPAEEEKPVVYRYGKLPTKELPSWWDRLDTDKDGQIGLYEWRAEKSNTMAEWIGMDLNADGYLPAEEYIRFKKQKDNPSSTAASSSSLSASIANESSKDSKDSKEAKDNKKKDDKKDKGGKSNPFRDR